MYVPVHGFCHTLRDGVRRRVTQKRAGFVYAGVRMAHVCGAEIAILRRSDFQLRHALDKFTFDQTMQIIERRAVANGHVVDLIQGIGILGRRCKQIGLNNVCNKAEIAAGLAIAVDKKRSPLSMADIHFGMTAA